jgi:hypothetical protein
VGRGGLDLLLTPTTPAKPATLGQADEGDPTTFTIPFNLSGQPAGERGHSSGMAVAATNFNRDTGEIDGTRIWFGAQAT